MDICIKDIEVIIDKSLEFASINDIIEYKIIIYNKTENDIKDFFVKINIPKNTIYCENSLTLKKEYELHNEYNGVIVNKIDANSMTEIMYKVKMISLANEGHIINKSFYSFKIANQNFEGITNACFVGIKSALIRKEEGFIRSISAGELKVGEVINFDILIKNTGNKMAYDLNLSDILPSNIEPVDKNIFVNNKILKLGNVKNISLGNLEPYKTLNVQYKALIKEVSHTEELFSISRIKYKNFDEDKNRYLELESLSNELLLDVREAVIKDNEDFICELNKKTYFTGEIIILTIKLKNTGNIKAENLNLQLNIPDNLKVEEYFIKKDKEWKSIQSLDLIKIESLLDNEEIKLELKMKSTDIINGEIIGELSYEYRDAFTKEIIYKKAKSNNVFVNSYTSIINDNLGFISKEVDKKIVTLDEEIEHTIFLENKGNIAAKNLTLTELEDVKIKYIPNTLIINEKNLLLENFECVFLGDLNPNEHKKIKYKTLINEVPLDNIITSKAYIEYEELSDEDLYFKKKIYCSENKIEIQAPKIECEVNINENYIYKNNFISSNLSIRNTGNLDCESVDLNFEFNEGIDIKNITCNINEKQIKKNEDGITIYPLSANEEIVVYFDIKVDTSKEISNTNYIKCDIKYDYFLENKLINKTKSISEKYFNIICDILEFKVSSSNTAVESEEEFCLDLYIKNKGSINLQELMINTSFLEEIEVLYCSENMLDGKIEVGSLLIEEYKVVKLILKCTRNIIIDKLELIFLIKYRYFFANELYEKQKSEIFDIEIMNSLTMLDMNVSEENIFVNDRFNIILKIDNIGKYVLKNAILEIEGENREFLNIDGDIFLQNKFLKVNSLLEKIKIGDIEANSTLALSYNLFSEKVENFNIRAKLTGTYEFSKIKEKREKVFYSEQVSIKIDKESAKIFLSTDKDLIYKNDEIKYKSVVINDGTIPLKLFYKMNVSSTLEEKNNFFEINGERLSKEVCKINGFDLNQGEGAIIESDYVYNNLFGNDKVFAQGVLEYKSKKRDSGIIELKSDKIINEVAISTFRELNIEHIENILEFEREILEISEVYIKPEVTNNYIIDKFSFRENKMLDKLFIKGRADIKIEYISNDDMMYLHSNYIDFATFIFMPKVYGDISKINIDITVKDLYYKIVDMSYLLINVNLFLKVIF